MIIYSLQLKDMIIWLAYKILKAQSHKWRWTFLQKSGDSFQSKKISLFFLSLHCKGVECIYKNHRYYT